MKSKDKAVRAGNTRTVRLLYIVTMVVMAFTGFGQMPIFKRYYVSDIPGMAWSADFYLTHYIHYVGASVLLALFAYVVLDYLLAGRKNLRVTGAAYIRLALLGGIVVTGVFRVLKNLPDVVFSPQFTMFIDISHLGFMMVFLFTALVFMMMKKGWVVRT